ncbi:MAG: FAD binding domain-containing protein, partial [Planctomycetota bacterium]|nr:FAD binding domain-containing protein [Planctomycetota bacterium]
MNRFEYVSPQKVTEAVDHMRGKGSIQAKAGGTGLIGLMKDRIISPEKVVNLQGLGLREIEVERTARIGALVTLDEIARSPQLNQGFTALAVAAAESATPQIRNMATVGGSLCQS